MPVGLGRVGFVGEPEVDCGGEIAVGEGRTQSFQVVELFNFACGEGPVVDADVVDGAVVIKKSFPSFVLPSTFSNVKGEIMVFRIRPTGG